MINRSDIIGAAPKPRGIAANVQRIAGVSSQAPVMDTGQHANHQHTFENPQQPLQPEVAAPIIRTLRNPALTYRLHAAITAVDHRGPGNVVNIKV